MILSLQFSTCGRELCKRFVIRHEFALKTTQSDEKKRNFAKETFRVYMKNVICKIEEKLADAFRTKITFHVLLLTESPLKKINKTSAAPIHECSHDMNGVTRKITESDDSRA